MIDSIPNPLADEGVKRDIEERVKLILDTPCNIKTLNDDIRKVITQAIEWGYLNGFRTGWLVYENSKGRYR